jgi:hypothetical protein
MCQFFDIDTDTVASRLRMALIPQLQGLHDRFEGRTFLDVVGGKPDLCVPRCALLQASPAIVKPGFYFNGVASCAVVFFHQVWSVLDLCNARVRRRCYRQYGNLDEPLRRRGMVPTLSPNHIQKYALPLIVLSSAPSPPPCGRMHRR